ncbi:MAG: hypothetical protein GXO69_10625 [Acidobacteria bacterium]|nr:hypothetical protein [Acidobacteriota bacterium]
MKVERFVFRFRLWRERPETALISSFAAAIFLGALLLMLPISTVSGQSTGFLTALFTSTSATCVTGLIVVDTGTHFSRFGQVIIMLLIQAGGLGIMTFTALFAWISRRKVSIQSQLTLRDTFLARTEPVSLKRLLLFILSTTAVIEGAGAAVLFFSMTNPAPGGRLFNALFHSVSAFCNAGFSLNSNSVMPFHTSIPVMSTIMLLIIFGGIGYPVMLEIRGRLKAPGQAGHWSLHTKTVILTTIILIFGGAFFIKLGAPDFSVLDALFQSVTTRTAGFNSVAFGHLPHAIMFVMIVLMFIGGSPGSCAGGIKTTTFSGMIVVWKDWLFGASRKRFFKRKLSRDTIRKIKAVIGLAAIWITLSFTLLLYTETRVFAIDPAAFQDILFEVVSAMGTVGLSAGVTPHLSTVGRVVIILDMFVGRVGPLAVVTALLNAGTSRAKIGYPEEKIMIG